MAVRPELLHSPGVVLADKDLAERFQRAVFGYVLEIVNPRKGLFADGHPIKDRSRPGNRDLTHARRAASSA